MSNLTTVQEVAVEITLITLSIFASIALVKSTKAINKAMRGTIASDHRDAQEHLVNKLDK